MDAIIGAGLQTEFQARTLPRRLFQRSLTKIPVITRWAEVDF